MRVRVSSLSWRACSYCPNPRRSDGKDEGRAQGVGVVVTQDPAAASEGVLAELACLLVLPQLPQREREAVGREQGMGVVVAQDPAAAGEGVLAELAGLLILPQLPQGDGEE